MIEIHSTTEGFKAIAAAILALAVGLGFIMFLSISSLVKTLNEIKEILENLTKENQKAKDDDRA